MGTGSMLVRATVTLFWVEAEEVWVVAAAPMRARMTTKARMVSFIMGPFSVLKSQVAGSERIESLSLSLSHATAVWVVGWAHGHRQHADFGEGDLILGGGGGGLSGGNGTGENQDDDEGAYNMFHNGIPLKLYSQKKISLDKANGVTIGYIME
jgi:hypothetical protein